VSKRGKLPLEDPRWLPLPRALEYCRRRIGSEFFAPLEMQQEFAGGRIRTAARYLDESTQPPTSKVALLTAASWKGRSLIWKRKGRLSDSFTKELHPSMIYVWQPDLEKRWPPSSPPPSERATEPHDLVTDVSRRRRPGPPRNKEWDRIVVRELLSRAGAGQKLPTAPEMLKFCGEKLDWEPDPRAMQRLLRLFADPELWRLLTEALK
jgi:hypothetical protein